MKTITSILLSIFFVLSCRKEVARKYYLLTYTFSSGETITIRGRIFEKDKKYKEKDGDDIGQHLTVNDPNAIIFGYTGDSDVGHQIYTMFKTKEEKLTGTWIQVLDIPNCSFANNQMIKAKGSIAVVADYKSPYRKFKVENGTFTYKWANAEDYGMNDTILTGTWTLKRE
jgi:hypothetical protein